MKVNCMLQIHGAFGAASSEDVWLRHEVDIPIPPQIGMEISDGDWNETVTGIWIDNGEIRALCGEDKEIYEAELRREPHRSIQQIVDEYIAAGWKPSWKRRK